MLRAEHLSVSYGESRVLRDISLEVPSGQVVCIMGRNVVGKTTLLKALMGVLPLRPYREHHQRASPQAKIMLDGVDLTHRSPGARARAGIGYVPQGRGIFPYLTVHENLLMGFEACHDRRPKAEQIDEMHELFPVLKQMRSRTAGTLSGGQQQQLALARALVRQPAVLLLDEPTEGIQPSIMHEIEDLIRVLRDRGDMSILLVEQFVDFALGVADYYYVMESGTIAAQGPVSQFDESIARDYLAI
jgi:urea transport system ATP-binding protein